MKRFIYISTLLLVSLVVNFSAVGQESEDSSKTSPTPTPTVTPSPSPIVVPSPKATPLARPSPSPRPSTSNQIGVSDEMIKRQGLPIRVSCDKTAQTIIMEFVYSSVLVQKPLKYENKQWYISVLTMNSVGKLEIDWQLGSAETKTEKDFYQSLVNLTKPQRMVVANQQIGFERPENFELQEVINLFNQNNREYRLFEDYPSGCLGFNSIKPVTLGEKNE